MEDLISIILPVYNGEAYLEDAIKSILKQTYSRFELIIVDDASTDSSFRIAKRLQSKDSRIKILKNQNNLLLPKSLNKGHRQAQGKFITWTSHDNILKSNFLESLYSSILNKNCDVIFSNYDIIWEDGTLKREHISGPSAHLIFGNFIGASFMYKKEVFNKLNGFKENLFLLEDHDFFLRGVLEFKFLHLDENLYQYRLHERSLTSRIQNDPEFANKLHNGLLIMYDKLGIFLHDSTKNFLVKLFLKDPVLKIYLNSKHEILNDLAKYTAKIQDSNKEILRSHLEYMLRINWFINSDSLSLAKLIRVFFKAPELLLRSSHNRNASLRIIYSSFSKLF